MSELITYDQVHAALREAVAERGEDYIYPLSDGLDGSESDSYRDVEAAREKSDWWEGSWCVYALPDGSPACIVGVVVSKLGIDPTKLVNGSAHTALQPFADYFEDPSKVIAGLTQAQMVQDRGEPWRYALEQFEAWRGQ